MEELSKMDIIKKLISTNYTSGRSGYKINQLTFHTAVGAKTSLFPYFNNPATQSSTHGCVYFSGLIEIFIEYSNTAWANANWPANCRSITFETEDDGNPNDSVRTDALYESCAQLAAQISKDYGIPLVLLTKEQALAGQAGFTKHSYFNPRSCPAGLDIQRIINRALIINNTPMPTFDYSLYNKDGNLYMKVLSGSINEIGTAKNLTTGTVFTETYNKSPGNDGGALVSSIDSVIYEVTAKGVVHQFDNRPITPPTPVDPCANVKLELQNANNTITTLNGQIEGLNSQITELKNSDILSQEKITSLTTDLKTANDQITELKKTSGIGILERILGSIFKPK